MAFDLDPTYKQVPERIADFKAKHPDGCLRPVDPTRPFWFEERDGKTFIVYAAAAYRSPEDPLPGIGMAWELFPGKTPYTKESELQNAETSAWGRAIVAVLASESKSVASAEDVRNRQAAEDVHDDGWYGWPDEAAARAEHDRMAERIAAMPDDVKTALREFRRQNSMGWPMSSAKWATFVEHANTLLTPQDSSGETPSPVSPDALPPVAPSHDEADGAAGVDTQHSEAASAPAASISPPVVERLRLRLNTLPDETRAAVQGVITATWGSLELVPEAEARDVSRLLGDAEKAAKTASGLASRAAGHANRESAA